MGGVGCNSKSPVSSVSGGWIDGACPQSPSGAACLGQESDSAGIDF